ncbi:hypothetical protein GVAV_002129 [Gurleya vavrai]
MRKENFMFKICLFIANIKSCFDSELRIFLTFEKPDVNDYKPSNEISFINNYKFIRYDGCGIKYVINTNDLSKQEAHEIKVIELYYNDELINFKKFYNCLKLKFLLIPNDRIKIYLISNKFNKVNQSKHIKMFNIFEEYCFENLKNFQCNVSSCLNELNENFLENISVYDSKNLNTDVTDSNLFTSDQNLNFEKKFAILLFSFKRIFSHFKNNNIDVDEEYAKIFEEFYDKYIKKKTPNTESENKTAVNEDYSFKNSNMNNPQQTKRIRRKTE